jgi:predicted PurR-regulated permease PerM
MHDLKLSDYVTQHSSDIAKNLQQPVSHAAGKIAFTGLSLVIALLTMFFMLRDGNGLRQPAYELLPLPPDRTEAIIKRIGETVYAVFIGTVLVAILQAFLLTVGFEIFHVPNAFLFGIMAMFLCTIPLIGATVVYIPAALIMVAQGEYYWAGAVVILGLAVTKLDYFLRPLLIGGRTNLHPIGIFFGILGGVLVFGPVGLVAGPMVLAVLLALQDVVRERVRATVVETAKAELTSSLP